MPIRIIRQDNSKWDGIHISDFRKENKINQEGILARPHFTLLASVNTTH